MKKQVVLIIALSLLLLLTSCNAESGEVESTEFLVACFRCEEKFANGQLNADFGLCQVCLMEAGAAYCKNCDAPCYTRDMIQGLCQTCSASATQETSIATTISQTTAVPEIVICEYCGYSVRSDYMIDGYCIGCYCIRQGKCLRCTHSAHLPDGCHCEHCSSNWFYCTSCDKRTSGNEMFLDLCLDCYWKINSVLVPCPLCGASYSPSEIKGGFCHSCYAQSTYEDQYHCASCGREYDTAEDLYDGLCYGCYHEANNLCISCGSRPSNGMGPSGMECAECYYESYATCIGCGYDYFKDDMYGEYCSSCGLDPLPGTYSANYENVRITVSYIDYEHYLTYTDLASGITLRNIPLSYCNAYTATEKMLMFIIDDFYPEHSGYVEFCVSIGARADYYYNALIDGLEDTGGDYSPLTKE